MSGYLCYNLTHITHFQKTGVNKLMLYLVKNTKNNADEQIIIANSEDDAISIIKQLKHKTDSDFTATQINCDTPICIYRCNRCNNIVVPISDNNSNYSYECFSHYESLYSIEVYKDNIPYINLFNEIMPIIHHLRQQEVSADLNNNTELIDAINHFKQGLLNILGVYVN